jgi:hypothetical protein
MDCSNCFSYKKEFPFRQYDQNLIYLPYCCEYSTYFIIKEDRTYFLKKIDQINVVANQARLSPIRWVNIIRGDFNDYELKKIEYFHCTKQIPMEEVMKTLLSIDENLLKKQLQKNEEDEDE